MAGSVLGPFANSQRTIDRGLPTLLAIGFLILSPPAAAQSADGGNLYGTYSPDGGLIAFESRRDGNPEIYVVRSDGTGARRLTTLPGRETTPAFSADGSNVVFTSEVFGTDGATQTDILVVSTEGGSPTVLVDWPTNEGRPQWSPNGRHLSFHTDRSGNRDVMVLDIATGAITEVTVHPAHDDWATWSTSGTLVFESERVAGWGVFTTALGNPAHRRIPLRDTVAFTNIGAPAISPDGTTLAFHASIDGGAMKLWLADLESGATQQVTDGDWDGLPAWSPDGRSVLFTRQVNGVFDLYVFDVRTGDSHPLLQPSS